MDPDLAITRAVEAAADVMFPANEVKVTSFRDEPTGRLVFRVTDDRSGEVLMQSPPDELLRFYASGRQESDGPLLRMRA